jgi:hypothetical protein
MYISRRMLTTTRLLAGFPHGEGLVQPSGRPNSIATTSRPRRMTNRKQRFSYTRPKIKRRWRSRGASCSVECSGLGEEEL